MNYQTTYLSPVPVPAPIPIVEGRHSRSSSAGSIPPGYYVQFPTAAPTSQSSSLSGHSHGSHSRNSSGGSGYYQYTTGPVPVQIYPGSSPGRSSVAYANPAQLAVPRSAPEPSPRHSSPGWQIRQLQQPVQLTGSSTRGSPVWTYEVAPPSGHTPPQTRAPPSPVLQQQQTGRPQPQVVQQQPQLARQSMVVPQAQVISQAQARPRAQSAQQQTQQPQVVAHVQPRHSVRYVIKAPKPGLQPQGPIVYQIIPSDQQAQRSRTATTPVIINATPVSTAVATASSSTTSVPSRSGSTRSEIRPQTRPMSTMAVQGSSSYLQDRPSSTVLAASSSQPEVQAVQTQPPPQRTRTTSLRNLLSRVKLEDDAERAKSAVKSKSKKGPPKSALHRPTLVNPNSQSHKAKSKKRVHFTMEGVPLASRARTIFPATKVIAPPKSKIDKQSSKF